MFSSTVRICWKYEPFYSDPDAVGLFGSHGNKGAELVIWNLTESVYTLTLEAKCDSAY